MSAPTRSDLCPGRWEVVVAQSRASFTARDVLHRPVTGTLPLRSAAVDVGPDGSLLSVVAALELAGVDTGNVRRDRDLRGRRFFDVQEHPVLRFRGGPAVTTPDGWTLGGSLGLGSMTCPVAVDVVRTGPTSVRATTTLDRRELGLTAPRLLVGAQVTVQLEVELEAPPS